MRTVLRMQLLKLFGEMSSEEITKFKYTHQRYIARPMLALSEYALRTTVEAVRRSPFFSLITDLSSDIAKHENMIIFVWYWDFAESNPVTTYLACLHLIGKDGSAMADAIQSVCDVLDLQLDRKLISLCADGDSPMQGHKAGLVGRLRSNCDNVLATHCAAHRQVLAVRDGANTGQIMSIVDGVITSVYNLFNNKIKRFKIWEMYALKHGVTAVRFQRFNATRWWSREVAVIQLVQCLPVLVSLLFVTRPSSKLYWPEAESARILLKRPLVLVALHFVADLLCVLRVSRKLFESTDFRIMQLQAELQSAIESLNTFAEECLNALCI
jgi:hypothetical protein